VPLFSARAARIEPASASARTSGRPPSPSGPVIPGDGSIAALLPTRSTGLTKRSTQVDGDRGLWRPPRERAPPGWPPTGQPPSLNRIDTSFEPEFATARSGQPSPLKSPTTTERGKLSATYLKGVVPKEPSSLPNSTLTLLLSVFATARSRMPSPLKSP